MLIGRDEVLVPPDENSFFESVSYQLDSPVMTGDYLRTLTCQTGLQSSNHFLPLVGGHYGTLCEHMENIQNNKFWDPNIADLVCRILYEALRNDLIVLRNKDAPLFYPSDAVLDEQSIVIIQAKKTPLNFHTTLTSRIRQALEQGNIK